VELSRRGLVPFRMLAVGADAVANLHSKRAVSERGIVSRDGAAESARPLGVGVDVFGELEVLVREAEIHHEVHPRAVTQGWMRRGRVVLLEHLVETLQLAYEKTFIL
jgi:hypothetical protein